MVFDWLRKRIRKQLAPEIEAAVRKEYDSKLAAEKARLQDEHNRRVSELEAKVNSERNVLSQERAKAVEAAASAKQTLESEKARLQAEQEARMPVIRDEVLAEVRTEVELAYTEEKHKEIFERVVAELDTTYGAKLERALKADELEGKVRSMEGQIGNMKNLVSEIRSSVGPWYLQMLDASSAIRSSNVRVVLDYISRDNALTLEVADFLGRDEKRIGYASRFFATFGEIYALAGDVDLAFLRRILDSGMSVDDARVASLQLVAEMKEKENLWSKDECAKFVLRRVNEGFSVSWLETARDSYSRNGMHRDFYEGLTAEELMVLEHKSTIYGGRWERYFSDLNASVSGLAGNIDPKIFSEIAIAEKLSDYEKKHNVDLSGFSSESA